MGLLRLLDRLLLDGGRDAELGALVVVVEVERKDGGRIDALGGGGGVMFLSQMSCCLTSYCISELQA